MKLTEEQFNKAFKVYKEHYTETVSPPECETCHQPAEFYDQAAGDNFCEACLEKSLRLDQETLWDYVGERIDEEN